MNKNGKAIEEQELDAPYKQVIRYLVRTAYQTQKVRIEMENRLGALFRPKYEVPEEVLKADFEHIEGVPPAEEVVDEEEDGPPKPQDEIISDLLQEYARLTDHVKNVTARAKYDYGDLIESYVELKFVDSYVNLKKQEADVFANIKKALKGVPIWETFLKDVTGVGPAIAGVLISELDPYKAPYPSSFWKYCGLHVIDGEGASRKKEHLVEVEYEDSEGNIKTKKSLGWNPFIKTKLIGVLAPSFLRTGSEYREHYDRYRHRIENSPRHEDKSDGHIHNMSLRYMVKEFLKRLHLKWRYLEDLPVPPPYGVAKLGARDHGLEAELGIEYDWDEYPDRKPENQ